MRRFLGFLIGFCSLASVYCMLGVIQAGMLLGAPQYALRKEFDEYFWSGLFGLFLALSLFFLLLHTRLKP